MFTLMSLLHLVVNIYMWIVIVFVVLQWAVSSKALNVESDALKSFLDLLSRLTEKGAAPIRKMLAKKNAVESTEGKDAYDWAPVILIGVLLVIKILIMEFFLSPFRAAPWRPY